MNIPAGWQLASLDDLKAAEPGALTDGPFGSNLKSEHYTDFGPRVVRLQNIGDGHFVDERAHISQAHYASLSRHEVRSGDILIAMLGERLPRACIAPVHLGPAIVKADCARLRVDDSVVSIRYLAHLLNSPVARTAASELVHGVGRPRLGLGLLRQLLLPIAPRTEQELVVSAIDSHFSRLDAATTTLERVQRNLERYRASVLKAAVEGRLGPTEAELARKEGRSYEPASVLLQRILAERRRRWEEAELAKFRAKGKVPADGKWKAKYPEPVAPEVEGLSELPEGWCWASVDAVGDVLLGRQRAPQYLTGKHNKPYLRVANIKDDRIDFSDVEQMDFDPTHFEKYRLQGGDILVSEGQSPEKLGQSAIFRGEHDGMCFQKTLHRFRPFSSGPSAAYAQLVFRSHVRSGVFLRMGSITTNIAHLTLEKFKAAPFPLPPKNEQERIELATARHLSLIDGLESAGARRASFIARLRQSILKHAFEGRLVPTEASATAPSST